MNDELPPRSEPHHDRRHPADADPPVHSSVPRGMRLLLFVVGGFLLLIGLVGLALPVIPQTVPLALGVALLSLASERVHRLLQSLLQRWPRVWRTIQAFRHRLEAWLSR